MDSKSIYFIFLVLVSISLFTVEASLCGHFIESTDDKCILLLSKEKVYNYTQALHSCEKQNATLIQIGSRDEQLFIEQYLFKNLSIHENVWTGLSLDNHKRIINKTEFDFKNWANGSPENGTNENWVQISSESNQRGKWTDESSDKYGLALCEKFQNLSIDDLRKRLGQKQKELQITTHFLKSIPKTCSTFEVSDVFIDDNGRPNAFIVPHYNNGGYLATDFNSANIQCKHLNASLIEIKSAKKQMLFEKFYKEKKFQFTYVWLNGGFNSDNRFEWFNSKEPVSYVNFVSNNCQLNSYRTLVINNQFKWQCVSNGYRYYVICEMNF